MLALLPLQQLGDEPEQQPGIDRRTTIIDNSGAVERRFFCVVGIVSLFTTAVRAPATSERSIPARTRVIH